LIFEEEYFFWLIFFTTDFTFAANQYITPKTILLSFPSYDSSTFLEGVILDYYMEFKCKKKGNKYSF